MLVDILHEWSLHMKFLKRAFGEFHKFSYEMTSSERIYLSYDSLEWDLSPSPLQNEHYFIKKAHC